MVVIGNQKKGVILVFALSPFTKKPNDPCFRYSFRSPPHRTPPQAARPPRRRHDECKVAFKPPVRWTLPAKTHPRELPTNAPRRLFPTSPSFPPTTSPAGCPRSGTSGLKATLPSPTPSTLARAYRTHEPRATLLQTRRHRTPPRPRDRGARMRPDGSHVRKNADAEINQRHTVPATSRANPSVRSLSGNFNLAPGSHRRWIPGVTAGHPGRCLRARLALPITYRSTSGKRRGERNIEVPPPEKSPPSPRGNAT